MFVLMPTSADAQFFQPNCFEGLTEPSYAEKASDQPMQPKEVAGWQEVELGQARVESCQRGAHYIALSKIHLRSNNIARH